jgi:hypothetical protein
MSCENRCPSQEDIHPCSCSENTNTLACFGKNVFSHELTLVGQQIKESKIHFNSIHIENTSLTHIEKETFPSGTYDQILIKNNENLQFIDSHAISGTVKKLEVVNNPKLNESIFSLEKNLKVSEAINLSSNNISSVPWDIFKSNAINIHLENNFIRKIESNVFSSLPNLEILNISNNLIDNIEHNGLYFITNKKQKIIFLNNNRLTASSFASNFISRLSGDSVVLHLEDNKIENLPEYIFRPFLGGDRHKIYMDNNPVECNCSMKWITEEPQSKHVYSIDCNGIDKSIFELADDELGCLLTTSYKSEITRESTTWYTTGYPTTSRPYTTGYPTTSRPYTTEYPTTSRPYTTEYPTTSRPYTTGYPTTSRPYTTEYPTTSRPYTTEYPTTSRPYTTGYPTTSRPYTTEYPTTRH